MADTAENLRTVIVGSTAIAAVFSGLSAPNGVAQAIEPQSPTLPRIWYRRSTANEELDIGGTGGLTEESFDIEVISDNLDEAQDIALSTKKFLNGKRGTFGTQSVQGVFVDDHNDEYIPRGVGDEEAYHVAALSVTIWHEST